MAIKLTIIGCSGSMSGPNSAASSYLVQVEQERPGGEPKTWSIVFDLGPGSFGALWKHVCPREIDAVVFTHGHADHMADVVSMYVYNRWYPSGSLPPRSIYGPACVKERVKQIDGWATDEELAEVFRFHPVGDRQSFEIGPVTITPFAARHTVESYGYRVEFGSASLALTGDTDSCESMTQMAAGADLLLSEAAFTLADTVRGIHLDGVRAGLLAAEAQVGELVLTHIQPWTDPQVVVDEAKTTWNGPLHVAAPGQVYNIS